MNEENNINNITYESLENKKIDNENLYYKNIINEDTANENFVSGSLEKTTLTDQERKKELSKYLIKQSLLKMEGAKVQRYKKKGLASSHIIDKIDINSYYISFVATLVIYGLLGLVTNFKKYPFVLDQMVIIFFILTLSHNIIRMIQVLVDKQDTENYFCMPIEEDLIFKVKIKMLLISSLALFGPIISYILLFDIKTMDNIFIGLLMGIVNVMIVFALLHALSVFIVMKLINSSLYERIEKKLVIITSTISGIFSLILIISVQFVSRASVLEVAKDKVFHNDILRPISFVYSHLSINIIIDLVLILVLAIYYKFRVKNIIMNFYGVLRDVKENRTSKVRKTMKSTGIKSWFGFNIKYNFRLIAEPEVFTYSIMPFITMIVLVILMIFLTLLDGNMKNVLSNLTEQNIFYLQLILIMSFALLSLFIGNNLSSILFSLEGENLNLMKAMPINFRKIAIYKSLVGTAFSFVPITIVYLCINLALSINGILKVDFLKIILSIIILLVICFHISLLEVSNDCRKPFTDWETVEALMGKIGTVYMLRSMGGYILSIAFIVLFLLTKQSIVLYVLIGIHIFIILFAWLRYNEIKK